MPAEKEVGILGCDDLMSGDTHGVWPSSDGVGGVDGRWEKFSNEGVGPAGMCNG